MKNELDLEGLSKTTRNLCHDSRYQRLSECEARVLTTRSRFSVELYRYTIQQHGITAHTIRNLTDENHNCTLAT
jgi:hypothetical protein